MPVTMTTMSVHTEQFGEHVVVEVADGIGTLRLARPKVNALTIEMQVSLGQAARRLGLSSHTVRDYVRSAREKLGVRTQLAAVVAAAGLGIVELPAPCEA